MLLQGSRVVAQHSRAISGVVMASSSSSGSSTTSTVPGDEGALEQQGDNMEQGLGPGRSVDGRERDAASPLPSLPALSPGAQLGRMIVNLGVEGDGAPDHRDHMMHRTDGEPESALSRISSDYDYERNPLAMGSSAGNSVSQMIPGANSRASGSRRSESSSSKKKNKKNSRASRKRRSESSPSKKKNKKSKKSAESAERKRSRTNLDSRVSGNAVSGLSDESDGTGSQIDSFYVRMADGPDPRIMGEEN